MVLWSLVFQMAVAGAPLVRGGALMQGLRPGLIAEVVVPFAERHKDDKRVEYALAPALSGWVHPGHYVPVQAHTHLVVRTVKDRVLTEGSFGLGATWVVNARKTYRLEDGDLRRIPLASHVVASPMVGFGVGRAGAREWLVRGRLGVWTPWQQRLALSWNLELVVRLGGAR